MAKRRRKLVDYNPTSNLTRRQFGMVLTALVFGLVGAYTLVRSHALTPTASIEAENGSLSGNVQSITNSGASGGAAVKFGVTTSAGPYLPYSADSFFKSVLPDNAPVDPTNDAGINFLKTFRDQTVSYPIINGLGSNKYGTVYFEGSCSDPVWTLTGTVPSEVSFLSTQGFHAPAALGRR